MKTLQDTAAFLFISVLAVLTLVSVLGVWEFFARDVIMKSFQTLGLIAMIAVMVCMERENHPMLRERRGEFSVGTIIAVGIFGWLLWWFVVMMT